MSRVRQERGTEQGRREVGRDGLYLVGDGVESVTESILAYVGEDEGLCPRFRGRRVWIKPTGAPIVEEEFLLVTLADMVAFLGYVCPRLQEKRQLREREVAVENAYEQMRQDATEAQRVRSETTMENEQLRQRVAALETKKEQLHQQLRCEQRGASKARKECANAAKEGERWKGLHDELYQGMQQGLQQNALVHRENERLIELNAKLRRDICEAEQGIDKAGREANEARVEASSIQKKLRETETAFEEAKKHFITAPDLVSSLRSLTDEVKTLQKNVQTNGERTAEMVVKRPEGRRSEKTLLQMKRVLHDLGRYPRRRRRAKAADAADDGRGAIRRGRICYSCRCKGHLAEECPQKRTADTVESSNPISDSNQSEREESNAEASSSGWSVLPLILRRTQTLFSGSVD